MGSHTTPRPWVRRWHIDATSKEPNIHAPEHGQTTTHQANNIITDSGLKGSVTLSQLEVLTTVDVVATVASFTRGVID